MNNIGKRINDLRRDNNMSQEQLAEFLRVSRQSISKWERGEALPDINNLEAIAKLFGVSIDSIVIKGYKDKPVEKTYKKENSGFDYSQKERVFTREEQAEYEAKNRRGTMFIIAAVVLYIMAGTSFILIESVFSDGITIAIFGVIVAIATGLVIYGGSIKGRSNRIYGQSCDDDDDKNLSPKAKAFSSIVMAIGTVTFFVLGFIYGMWYISWVAFPIAGVLSSLGKHIFPLEEY